MSLPEKPMPIAIEDLVSPPDGDFIDDRLLEISHEMTSIQTAINKFLAIFGLRTELQIYDLTIAYSEYPVQISFQDYEEDGKKTWKINVSEVAQVFDEESKSTMPREIQSTIFHISDWGLAAKKAVLLMCEANIDQIIEDKPETIVD
jgi:hypothetical protein